MIALKYILILTVYFSLFVMELLSQPSITWQRIYNSPSQQGDYGWDICNSTGNSFFVLGRSSGVYSYLLRINEYGNVIWSRTDTLSTISIVSTGDGGCIIPGGKGDTTFTMKIDSNGNTEWIKFYQINVGGLWDIKKVSDGGYVMCGFSGPLNSRVIKVDSAGNLQWSKIFTYSGGSIDLYNVTEALNTGFVIAGSVFDPTNRTRAAFIRLSYSGDSLWQKYYKPSPDTSIGAQTIESFNNKYIVSGTIFPPHENEKSAYIMHMDSSGAVTYLKAIPHLPGHCEALQDFRIKSQNKFIFSTIPIELNVGFCNGPIKARIFITDSMGNIIASNLFTTSQDIELRRISFANNGDILFAGVLESHPITNFQDIYAIRTDSNLNTPPIGINMIGSETPTRFHLYQNYPNPFNPVTKIKFDIPYNDFVTIDIFDTHGKLIETLLHKQLVTGRYEVDFNGSTYASGVYFYRINTQNYSLSKKMILIK